MATYKVLQDIEAEDKFLGPLTLRQFIYAAITVVSLYLSFIATTKQMPIFLAVLLPPAFMAGILAWPWSGQQTTEVWLLAKVRFWLKPRLRKWDQSGIKELVTITVPKRDEKIYTNGLDQTEVKSRLQALAQTIDSRGWAIKNVAVNLNDLASTQTMGADSDRLVSLASLPQEVSGLDIQDSDDILDERSNPIAMHFEEMIKTDGKQKRKGILAKMQEIREHQEQSNDESTTSMSSNEPWFMQPGGGNSQAGQAVFTTRSAQSTPIAGVAAGPTATDEEQLLDSIHEQEKRMDIALGQTDSSPKPQATSSPTPAPAILKTIGSNDAGVAKLPRETIKPNAPQSPEDEVVISLR